ncbi:MAG: holo-ACP synthase [Rhodobacteraceae bacterium]|nr:holo-ACP synthase [Paracoccaceae bacterium]
MIIGIGIDIVNINRIQRVIIRHENRFLDRIYTPHELLIGNQIADKFGYFAKRWAAKEACSKALGTGLRKGVFWRDIEIHSHKGGLPFIVLHGGALQHLKNLTPKGYQSKIHLTMSDDHPSAIAQVTIDA